MSDRCIIDECDGDQNEETFFGSDQYICSACRNQAVKDYVDLHGTKTHGNKYE